MTGPRLSPGSSVLVLPSPAVPCVPAASDLAEPHHPDMLYMHMFMFMHELNSYTRSRSRSSRSTSKHEMTRMIDGAAQACARNRA